jgi:basic amino acid/polyamine antiporter, APA family
MSTSTESHSHRAAPTELKRTLGMWQVMFYGLGSMLGAGIYALVGKAAGLMGNAVWLAFAAAMVAALLTGLSYASLGSRYPRAGGAAYITQHAFRIPLLSYVIGFAVMMSGLTSMATGTQAIAENLLKGYHIQTIDPDSIQTTTAADAKPKSVQDLAGERARDSGWIKPIAIAFVFLVGLVLIRGIRESMWANLTCTFVEAAGLLFVIAVGIRFWGSVDYLEFPTRPEGEPLDTSFLIMLVLGGAVLTFFSFIGFEDILNVSEEVKNPSRDVPFGLVGAMVLATIIYMCVAITAVSVIPYEQLSKSGTPLMDVAHKAAPWFAGIDKIYLVITIFAIGNTALLNYLMGSRLLYGMSRQGLLPAFVGTVHARTHTPVTAIIVLFVIVTALILSGGVKALAESTVLLLLCVFVAMNSALVLLKIKRPDERGRFEIPILVPILGVIVCLALLLTRMIPPFLQDELKPDAYMPPLVSAAIIGVAVVLYFILAPKKIPEEGTIESDRA